MYKQTEKSKQSSTSTHLRLSKAVSTSVGQRKMPGFVDNRSESTAQRKLRDDVIHTSQDIVQKKSEAVIQRAEPEDTINNIMRYSFDTYDKYGAALIRKVCADKRLRVRGHASGKTGDGMNKATEDDIAILIPHLQAAEKALSGASEPEKSKVVDKSKKHNETEMKAAAERKLNKKEERAAAKKAEYDAKHIRR